VELISNLNDGEITFVTHDNFTDLCRGGHIPNTGIVKAIKILNAAGAIGEEMKKSSVNKSIWYFFP
jgi:threonyl-tRNA synthetase